MASRAPLEELRKQLVDQPLHFLWAAGLQVLPFVGIRFLGPLGALLALVTLAGDVHIILREKLQLEDGSHLVGWLPDCYLDWGFFSLGAVAGVAVGWWVVL